MTDMRTQMEREIDRGMARTPRSDEDLTDAICRMLSALAVRIAGGDPDGVTFLRLVGMRLDECYQQAVAGFRQSGFTDAAIARELGVTRQAVQKRWPR